MKFVSYAQNFEDVTLWRTLKLFGPAQYIDIGANHPTLDSVSRSLYERGWRGINVEPVKHFYDALCKERPDEVNLRMAVGSAQGTMDFFENIYSGLSTLDAEFAKKQMAAGLAYNKTVVEIVTLDSICEKYLDTSKPFHFLKVDVEGYEAEVFKGFDIDRWQPWVIVAESSFDTIPSWHTTLADHGYRFAKFDAVNRYYVSSKHLELLKPLEHQPNVLDNFVLRPGHPFSNCPPVPVDEVAPACSVQVSDIPTRRLVREIFSRATRKLAFR
jgi:FkbM family methyltransferase